MHVTISCRYALSSMGRCFCFLVLIYFHCSASIPYHGQKVNWPYQGWKFLGTFVPPSESSWELSFLGAKVPLGTFTPRSKNNGERKVLIPFFVPDDGGRQRHSRKFFKRQCRLDIKKFTFINIIVDNWNSLSDKCVSCTTLNNFKSHIHLHRDWKPESIV